MDSGTPVFIIIILSVLIIIVYFKDDTLSSCLFLLSLALSYMITIVFTCADGWDEVHCQLIRLSLYVPYRYTDHR